jgi:hypothetical protein
MPGQVVFCGAVLKANRIPPIFSTGPALAHGCRVVYNARRHATSLQADIAADRAVAEMEALGRH